MNDNVWAPNLLIPGVAKCGTTTIFDLLEGHPRVTGGIEKEVRFLMDAGDDLETAENVRERGLAGWRARFPDRGEGDFDVWVDASPQYQFQRIALPTVAALACKPKVLIMVREPSRRLFSMYQYARYHQRAIPWIGSFAEFIDALRAPSDPRILRQRMLANAWRDSRYDEFIAAWRAALPPGHLKVISIESLSSDRVSVLGGLAHWLGIDADPLIDNEVRMSNATVVTRSRALRKVGGQLARLLPENPLLRRAKNAVKALNSGDVDNDEIVRNETLMAQIALEFATAMERTEALRLQLEDEIAVRDQR